MDLRLHDPSDLPWLAGRIDAETDARQRDRYPHMLAATDAAVQTLNAERIKTLCTCSWMMPRN